MPAQKRLLVVSQHFWPENFRISDIVRGFLADGIAVDVLCGLPNYPLGEWFDGYSAKGPLREDWQGARLFRCREIPRRGNSSLRIFLNYVSWPLAAAAALRRLPKPGTRPYDAVLCYNTSPVLMSWPAILAARRYKVPLANYVLDIWPENLYSVLPVKNRLLRGIAAAVSDWHYRRADRLIGMSAGLAARLQKRVGTDNRKGCGKEKQKRFAVIPQYCEDFYALPACDEDFLKQNAGRLTLLFAGNFSPAQSLSTALEALAILMRQETGDARKGQNAADAADTPGAPDATSDFAGGVPVQNTSPAPRWQLVLVGDGMSRAALQQQAEELGLGERVRFFGSVAPERVPALAGAADALLVSLADSPDLGLTVPAKLASCMAMQKPLLVSMNGEGAAAARESGGAFVSAAGDAAALAANLRAFAALSADARAQLGQRAYSYYQSHYRRSLLLRQLEDFIF